MLSLPSFGGATALSASCSLPSQPPSFLFFGHLALKSDAGLRVPCCSLRVQELSLEEQVESRPVMREFFGLTQNNDRNASRMQEGGQEEKEEEEKEEEKGISKIRVARQKYIPVSKAELMNAIVLKLFDSQDDADQFILLSSCLDSILHAEHKGILEEMRTDYFLTHSMNNLGEKNDNSASSDGKDVAHGKNLDSVCDRINEVGSNGSLAEETAFDVSLNFSNVLDLRSLLSSSADFGQKQPNGESRLAAATRFQRASMQLLSNAQFQELSAGDLMLTSALNSDYLLTLPIYVDWKKAYESNAIIFRRGYATERQKGLLIVEKLDYIQSRLLQQIFFLISKPLGKIGKWIKEAIQIAPQTQGMQDWVKRMALWLEELSLLQQALFNNEQASNNPLGIDQLSNAELPIWLAAQRAVSRYEGFLSPVGPRGRLFRRLLTWTGIIPPIPEIPFELDSDNNATEPHLRFMLF
uniref:Uncharacterized protein LOC105126210 isoform X2 n=1 Tax=Rhizophora mucronata TaxID=61149 RepID=A0A2P2LBU2_RHIMU